MCRFVRFDPSPLLHHAKLNVRGRGLGRGRGRRFSLPLPPSLSLFFYPSKCDLVAPFGSFVPVFGFWSFVFVFCVPVLLFVCFLFLLRASAVLRGSLGGSTDPPWGYLGAAVGRSCFLPARLPAWPCLLSFLVNVPLCLVVEVLRSLRSFTAPQILMLPATSRTCLDRGWGIGGGDEPCRRCRFRFRCPWSPRSPIAITELSSTPLLTPWLLVGGGGGGSCCLPPPLPLPGSAVCMGSGIAGGFAPLGVSVRATAGEVLFPGTKPAFSGGLVAAGFLTLPALLKSVPACPPIAMPRSR